MVQKSVYDISAFALEVYNLVASIPKGKVSSYSDIARALGKPGAARAVGTALNRNPFTPQVPCHRVVKRNGLVGGFFDGYNKKLRLLKQEGVKIKRNRVAKECFYGF